MKNQCHINLMKQNQHMLAQSITEFFVTNVDLFLIVVSLMKVHDLQILLNIPVTSLHLQTDIL